VNLPLSSFSQRHKHNEKEFLDDRWNRVWDKHDTIKTCIRRILDSSAAMSGLYVYSMKDLLLDRIVVTSIFVIKLLILFPLAVPHHSLPMPQLPSRTSSALSKMVLNNPAPDNQSSQPFPT
jgi:hypothetical protein